MAERHMGIPIPLENKINRKKGVNGKLLSVALGTAITVGGCGILEVLQRNQGIGVNPSPSSTENGSLPSLEPTSSPTLEPTPQVTPSPEVTPSPSPEPTPTPVESPEVPAFNLEKNLEDWVNGDIKVAKSKYFWNTSDGFQYKLNIVEEKNADLKLPSFHGVYLGSEIVDNHLIGYVGHQDGKGDKYFVPVTMGTADSDDSILLNVKHPDTRILATRYELSKLMDIDQLREALDSKVIKDTIIYSGITYETGPADVHPKMDYEEITAQAKLAKQYTMWCLETKAKKGHTDRALLKKYPLVKNMINNRLTEYDPKKTMFIYLLYSGAKDLF